MAVSSACPTAIALSCFTLLTFAATAAAYTNYTVGGDKGWFFNATTNATSANYSSWAASQTFNLGDFLLFNSNSNQTIVQTYNLTTYDACNTDDASNDDTFHYDAGTSQFGQSLTVAVPLTIEGPNYFFSDADDGIQCLNGMRFEINVKHGSGLPPSLNQPPPPPYAEPPGPDSAQAQSPPVTVSKPSQNGGFSASANFRQLASGLILLLAMGIF